MTVQSSIAPLIIDCTWPVAAGDSSAGWQCRSAIKLRSPCTITCIPSTNAPIDALTLSLFQRRGAALIASWSMQSPAFDLVPTGIYDLSPTISPTALYFDLQVGDLLDFSLTDTGAVVGNVGNVLSLMLFPYLI